MAQCLLPMGEDDKKAGIGNMLRTINNTPSSGQKTGEDNENNKSKIVTLKHVKESKGINQAFERAELVSAKAGIIKHGKRHAEFVAQNSGEILKMLGFPSKDVNLAQIAGYLHDLGYRIEIDGHSLVSAGMAYERLSEMNMDQGEIDRICLAIGYHNQAIQNNIGAALVIAEFTDFSKERVRDGEQLGILAQFMKNTTSNKVIIDNSKKLIILDFQIQFQENLGAKEFLLCQKHKIQFCKEAAEHLQCSFKMIVNGQEMI